MNTNHTRRAKAKEPIRYYTYDRHGEIVELPAPVPQLQTALFTQQQQQQAH
jgi:hypothetical protein